MVMEVFSEPVTRMRPALGTFVRISVTAAPSVAAAGALLAAAFAEVARWESVFSAYDPGSVISRINALSPGDAPIPLPEAVRELLAAALTVAELSAGAFDPVRAGVALVRRGRRPRFADTPPDAGADWRHLVLAPEGARVLRPLHLDLGGAAKGWVADRVAALLRAGGGRGVVDAGGDLAFTHDEDAVVAVRAADGSLRPERVLSVRGYLGVATSAAYGSADATGNDLVNPSGRACEDSESVTCFAASCATADMLTKVVLFAPEPVVARCLKEAGACAYRLSPEGNWRAVLPESSR